MRKSIKLCMTHNPEDYGTSIPEAFRIDEFTWIIDEFVWIKEICFFDSTDQLVSAERLLWQNDGL